MATDLGKAYVQIMPSAKGISGSIQKTLNPEASKAGKSAGKRLSTTISNSLSNLGSTLTKNITLPALGAVTAISGLVGALGFRRLIGMDNARAKLEGMGYEGERLTKVMNDAREAVTGTTMTMAEGVDIASGALAAGVKQGEELQHYIKLVGSAAVGANRPVSDMAMIFNRVQGAGKLMTMELNMIEQGMPGFAQAMADTLAKGSMENFREMVTNGEVGSADFLKVMDKFAGGMADAYAGTWSGMAKNVVSNIGIIGESLIGGLFEDGKQGLANFLEILRSDSLKDWAKSTGESIREFTHDIIDGAKQLIDWWNKLSPIAQETAKKIALFGTLGVVSFGPLLKIVAPLVSAIGALIPVFAALFSPVGLVIGAIATLTAGIIHLWKTNETFRNFIVSVWEGIKSMFSGVIDAIVGFVMEKWNELVEWWAGSGEMILEATRNVWNFISKAIEIAMDVIWSIMQFIWPLVEMLIVQVWNNIKGVIDGAIKVITGIIDFFAALFTGNWSALWDSVKQIIIGAVQFLWNIINLWFVGRILGVARNFVGIFGNVIRGGFNVVRGLFSGGLNAIRSIVTGGLNSVRGSFTNIMNGLRGIVSNAFKSVRNAISNGMTNAFNAVKGFFGKFKNAGRNIVTSIADGIKGAISVVTDAISGVATKIRNFLPFSPPKEGPLIDIMDVKWGETISGGIEKGEGTVAKAMEDMLAFDLTKKATFNHAGRPNDEEHYRLPQQQNQPIILQVDGKTFAQIMGDYTSVEGGNRIRKIERGLA